MKHFNYFTVIFIALIGTLNYLNCSFILKFYVWFYRLWKQFLNYFGLHNKFFLEFHCHLKLMVVTFKWNQLTGSCKHVSSLFYLQFCEYEYFLKYYQELNFNSHYWQIRHFHLMMIIVSFHYYLSNLYLFQISLFAHLFFHLRQKYFFQHWFSLCFLDFNLWFLIDLSILHF